MDSIAFVDIWWSYPYANRLFQISHPFRIWKLSLLDRSVSGYHLVTPDLVKFPIKYWKSLLCNRWHFATERRNGPVLEGKGWVRK